MDRSVQIRLFADDCIIYKQVKRLNDQAVLNKSLEMITEWCDDWQMSLNNQKCAHVTITRGKKNTEF